MKLAVFVNYEDAGNLKMVDVDRKDVREEFCPLINDGIADLIRFDNGKMYQAAVEMIEPEEDDEEAEEDWGLEWQEIRQERR